MEKKLIAKINNLLERNKKTLTNLQYKLKNNNFAFLKLDKRSHIHIYIYINKYI